MATAEDKLRSDFLSCSICYEVYKCPKSLPCLHTFCEKCLESYILAENDTYGVESKSCFPCPICRCIVKPKSSFRPLGRWADDFPTNFFIEGLISTFMTNKDEQTTHALPTAGLHRSGLSSSQQNYWESIENYATPQASLLDFQADDIVAENCVITNLPRVKSSKTFKLVKTLYGMKKSGEAKFNAVCVLKERIVALDFQNQMVQMFYNWEAKLDVNVMIDTLALPTKPASMVAINDSMIVVTLPSRKELCIISVDGQDADHPKLEVVYSMKTLKSYKCVKMLPDGKFLAMATEVDPSYLRRKLALDVLGHSGNCLDSIRYGLNLKAVIPTSITVDPAGQIYIIDLENKIYCLTQDGKEVFRYDPNDTEDEFQRLQNLEYGHGNIYLTDMDANRVLKLTNDCGFPSSCEILLSKEDGVCKPMDVSLGPDGTLYIACWDGCVRVYAVKPGPSILKNKVLETTL